MTLAATMTREPLCACPILFWNGNATNVQDVNSVNTRGRITHSACLGVPMLVRDSGAAHCRHLAASEGCYKVSEWLINQNADVNRMDRFKRTPLEVMESCPRVSC